MIPHGIEDEYDIVQILQETAATAVLLVNYKKIGALRILKAIHRAHPNAPNILSEAHLLQGIKSSQIPTIYSVEDTAEMNYLVEEFVEGPTLREYLLETKLSKEELIQLSISLCDVMEALHMAKDEPVIYRDLKPEHIILQEGRVRLIDFGISVKKSKAAKAVPLGTKKWAAPEQLIGGIIDERCDIYSVGKIIEYMQINSYGKDDYKIRKIVNRATMPDIEKRTSSIKELKHQLYELNNSNDNENGKGNLEKKIAVVGTDHAVGTTLIAINMCRYLNKIGKKAYYRDVEGDCIHKLMSNLEDAVIKEGILYHKKFKGIINYGDAVEPHIPPNGLKIIDCGTNIDKATDCDVIIMVINLSPWKNQNLPTWINDKSIYILGNLSSKLDCIKLAKRIKKQVYKYPQLQSVKRLNKEEERIFSTILQNEKDI